MSAILSTRSLYLEVADLLRQRILGGAIQPDEWIDELRLAAEFGISRTPLREALKVLAAEGLVTIKPRRGAYVSALPAHELGQLFHLLALLEADAAAAVARKATDAELSELESLNASIELAAGEPTVFYGRNVAFHARLLELTGNRWQAQMVQDLRKLVQLARAGSLSRPGRIADSLRQHRDLLAALRARDADGAAACMRAHILGALDAAPSSPS